MARGFALFALILFLYFTGGLSARSERALSSQWFPGGFNPWGAPKPKTTTTPKPESKVPVPISGGDGQEIKCTMKKFEGIYFYGKVSTVGKNVENENICAGVCWQLRKRGLRCSSVNYLRKQGKCEIMDDQLNMAAKTYQMHQMAESEPNSIYVVLVKCDDPSGGGGTVAKPTPTPTPAYPMPEGELPPAGSCGRTMVRPRISDDVLRGRSSLRIVNGVEAAPHSFPWIVGFEDSGEHFCGGTLVRVRPDKDESDIVVTASHCLQDNPSRLLLQVGAHRKDGRAPNQRTLASAKWVMHPQYDRDTVLNDVAIVKLNETVKFGRTIQPACLPEHGDPVPEGLTPIVSGWGSMQEGSFRLPNVLMQVPVKTINFDFCSKNLYPGELYAPQMFCAGHLEGGKDSCQGDSGGPLVFNVDKRWILRGVVSFGEGCARAGKPGIYANVSHFMPWLRETIAQVTSIKA